MNQNLIDLKVSLMAIFCFTVQFSEVEKWMKVIVFILTIGFTVHRWILMVKNKKE
jgi:uncharacterized membrane protein YjjB (DUF3815 family)